MMDIDHDHRAYPRVGEAPPHRCSDAQRVDAIEAAAIALDDGPAPYAPLLCGLGRASWGLLGSAGHGTQECCPVVEPFERGARWLETDPPEPHPTGL